MRSGTLLAAASIQLLLVAAKMSAAEAPTPQEMTPLEAEYRALMKPRVTGTLATPAAIQVGRAEIKPVPGTKVYQLQALARPCGLLIDGPATLTYRIEDRHSVPLADRNVSGLRALKLSTAGELATLSAALDHAAVWSWELATAFGTATPEARPLPGWLDDHLNRQFGSNPGRDMLLSSWNKDPGYSWSFFETGGEELVLDVDPRPQAKAETLARFEQIEIAARPYGGRRYPQELAAQPIGRAWTDAVAIPYVVVANDLALDNDKALHVTTRAKIKFTANDDLRLLPLALWSEIAHEETLQPYRVVKLSVNGASASFVHHEDTLLVHLPQLVSRGQSFDLEVEAEGEILERPASDNYWLLSYAPWYPLPHEGLTRASFKVAVSTPAPYVPFASGSTVKRESQGDRNLV